MVITFLAFALAAGSAGADSAEWRPSGCGPSNRLTAAQIRTAESEAAHGDITASVSLECHYLAVGQPGVAARWLKQSAEREPLTGRRYVNYLLQQGGKANCQRAYELTQRYLAWKWDFPELNRELAAQQRRANGCR